MSRKTGKWYRTGECRIVPWWFGLMRAEFLERRDFTDPTTGEVMEYQLRAVRAGSLPAKFDGPSAFGFWSTMATPRDRRYGDRALWRQFITYFSKIPDAKPTAPAERKATD
jgi:hypothetical protein